MSEKKDLLNPKNKIVEIVETGKCYYFKETPKKNLKVKTTRGLIVSFDTFFSVFVVAFLIIANWRGTWGLMDIYTEWFPAYESFLVSTTLHIAFAFFRDILQDSYIQYKERLRSNYPWKFFVKFYIYFFNVMCNMQWRSGWIIMDEYCGIETDQLGNALPHNDPTLCVYVTIVSIILLAMFKSLRNICGSPFIIVLDEEDSIFHFPTRFRVRGFYLTIFLLRHNFEAALDLVSLDNETTSMEQFSTNSTISSVLDYKNSTPLAEKLMSDANPLPFHNNFRGPPPTSFIPLSNQHYPQLQNYVRPGYPRNIQEIINYIHPEPQKPKKINFNHDPFHSYKPKDPSDINLLATSNLRFAPPIWKDLKTNPLVPAPSSYKPRYEGKKPIELTLNVFPMPNDGSRSNYFGFAGGQRGRAKFEGGRGMRARKMVIHLNFYSEEDEEEIEKRFLEGNYESLEDILSQQEDGK